MSVFIYFKGSSLRTPSLCTPRSPPLGRPIPSTINLKVIVSHVCILYPCSFSVGRQRLIGSLGLPTLDSDYKIKSKDY